MISGEVKIKESFLPVVLDQGHELGTPSLLQVYRLLRNNPQLRQAPQLRSIEEDEPYLVNRALYAFLHSRATLHAMYLALEQLRNGGSDQSNSSTEIAKQKYLLTSALAQLLAREVLIDSTPNSEITAASPRIHVQISSYVLGFKLP